MTAVQPGRCQVCGCCGGSCRLLCGDLCAWYDAERTVCSQPACIREYERRQHVAEKAVRAARRKHGDRFVGMGFGAIVDQMRRDARARSRRRKKKAA